MTADEVASKLARHLAEYPMPGQDSISKDHDGTAAVDIEINGEPFFFTVDIG